MVDLNDGLANLPTSERLKKLRAIEAEKRRQLEDELVAKKQELDELEVATRKDLAAAEALEEEAEEELSRDRAKAEVTALEERLAAFKKGTKFVSETTREETAVPGFGQQGANDLYQSNAFQQAQEGLDYLLNANGMSDERRVERERDVYQSVRNLATNTAQGLADESYAVNKLQKEVQQLKDRGGEDSFGYWARIENVLNNINDYKR